MTMGTTGDSPKSEYQVNSFEAGDLYIYNHAVALHKDWVLNDRVI